MGSTFDPTSSDFLGGNGQYFDPLNLGGRPSGGLGGDKNSPAPPDYMGLAQQMGDISEQNTAQQTWANRPDQNTPWGSTTWDANQTIDPATGLPVTSWTQNTNLTPEQQAIFESQQQLQAGRSGLANTLLGNASDTLQNPADWSQLPEVGNGMDARNAAEDAIFGRMSSRLDPQWTQRADQQRTQLYNMGLREGDSAFDQQMGNFNRDRTDAYEQAMNTAIAGGGQEMSRQFGQEMAGRQQSISEMLGERSSTLNELQALMNGQQVGMPGQPQFTGAGQPQTPNLLGAANMGYGGQLDQFNAQQAQQQGLLSGGMNLAALAYMFSDSRLKEEIRYLDGEALPGVRWATWKWKTGGRGRGVIAQDVQRVRPDLVKKDPASGYLMVNMAGIGG